MTFNRHGRCVLPLLVVLLGACSGSGNSPNTQAQPAPVAVADAAQSDNGREVAINVLANDQAQGTTLRIDTVDMPSHGQVRIDGAYIVYRPTEGFFGVDRFRYRIRNERGQTASADISVSSAIALTLRGRVNESRSEALTLRAQTSLGVEMRSLPALTDYEIRVRSEHPDTPIYLEATGTAPGDQPLRLRYASLLPAFRELIEVARCNGFDCTLDVDLEPRLLLGALPTAEYGLLRALASHDTLMLPGKRRDLLGYLTGEAVLRNASLVLRGVSGLFRRDEPLLVQDTLELAVSESALRQIHRPIGSPGSGSVTNEFNLDMSARSIASTEGWNDSGFVLAGRLARQELVWLAPPRGDRLFTAWAWRGGRLLSQGDVRLDPDPLSVLPREHRRALMPQVAVSMHDHVIEFRPVTVGEPLASVRNCVSTCTTQRVDRIVLQPFLRDYAVVERHGVVDDESVEGPLWREMATLATPLRIALPSLPTRIFTTVRLSAVDGEHAFISDDLELRADQSFVISDAERPEASAVNPHIRSGHFQLLGSDRELSMIDASSDAYTTLQVLATGVGRSLTLIWTGDGHGVDTVAAGAWLPLSAPAPQGFPSAPFECVPAIDGVAPLGPIPATRPAGLAYHVASDGTATNSVGDAFRAAFNNEVLRLWISVVSPPASLSFTPVAQVGAARLFYVGYQPSRLAPRPWDQAVARAQHLGAPELLDCH